MYKGMVGLVAVLFCGALLFSGCAKKEMVRPEELTEPPVTSERTVTPPPKAAPEEEGVKDQSVKESPVATAESKTGEEAPTVVAANELEKIFFDLDSFILSPAARDSLTKNAKWLEENRNVKVQIEGHCDQRGSDEYNLALGEKRARAAMNYLVTLGVPASQLSIISFGKEKPADTGDDETAWAKNRRAEFVILK